MSANLSFDCIGSHKFGLRTSQVRTIENTPFVAKMTFQNRQNIFDKRTFTAPLYLSDRQISNLHLGTSISATPKSDLKIDFEKIRTPDNTTNYVKSNSIKPNIIKHKLQETLATSYADKKPILATVSF